MPTCSHDVIPDSNGQCNKAIGTKQLHPEMVGVPGTLGYGHFGHHPEVRMPIVAGLEVQDVK